MGKNASSPGVTRERAWRLMSLKKNEEIMVPDSDIYKWRASIQMAQNKAEWLARFETRRVGNSYAIKRLR